MRFRITILLLIANAAVFGLLWLSTRNSREITVTAPLFGADIREISIEGSGVPQPYTLAADRNGNNWRLTAPYEWEADPIAVETLRNELRYIKLEDSFTLAEAKANGSTLASYGLEKPEVSVSVRSGGATEPTTIHIGRDNGEKIYLLAPVSGNAPDAARIIPASRRLRDTLVTNPDTTLRSRTIFSLEAVEVQNISIRAASDSGADAGQFFQIRRGERPVPDRADMERIWQFVTPFAADAGTRSVDGGLERLVKLPFIKFIPAPRGDTREFFTRHGLEAPWMSITLEGANRAQTLTVGQRDPASPDAAPTRFARLEISGKRINAIFTIADSEIKEWRVSQNLREEEFFHFHPSTLSEITIYDGKRKLVLHRRNASEKTAAAQAAPQAAPADATAAAATTVAPATSSAANGNNLGISAADIGEWNIPALPDTEAKITLDADPVAMRDLIETLRYIRAQTDFSGAALPLDRRRLCSAFVSDAPKDAELKSWNFASPVRRVELTFRNNIPSRTLLLAAPVSDDTPPHAKIADAPSVYSIRPNLLDAISAAPGKYRHRLVTQIAAEEIVALSITNLETGNILLKLPQAAPATAAANKNETGATTTTPAQSQPATVPATVSTGDAAPAAAAPANPLLAGLSAVDATQVRALLESLRQLRATAYFDAPFSPEYKHKLPAFREPFPWLYRLDVTVQSANATQPETRQFYFTKRLDGVTQIAGAPAQGCVFKITQPLLDALFPLTFAKEVSREIPTITPPPNIPPVPAVPPPVPAEAAK